MSTDNFEVSEGLLRYDSSIDKKVAPAVASVLKTDVLKVKKINKVRLITFIMLKQTNILLS